MSEESFYAPHEWYEQDSFAQALGGHLADINRKRKSISSAGIYQAGLPEEVLGRAYRITILKEAGHGRQEHR